MYIHVYIYLFINIYVYICIYICMYIFIFISVCVHCIIVYFEYSFVVVSWLESEALTMEILHYHLQNTLLSALLM